MTGDKKSILITGGNGYLGSRLVEILLSIGHSILVLKRMNTIINSLGNEFNNLEFFNIEDGLTKPFEHFNNIDLIIHTATAYDNTLNSHEDINYVNWIYPTNLIDLAISNGVKYFINTDTALPKEIDHYAYTKCRFREYGTQLLMKNKITFINMKIEYIYGQGKTSNNLPYYLIKSCFNNVVNINLSKGEQKRDFIHVDDVIAAYTNIIDSLEIIRQPFFEIGLGTTISIKDLAIYIRSACYSTSNLNFGYYPYRKHEVMESVANIDAIKGLGWRPRYSLEEGLSNVIAYEKNKGQYE